ncbi:MAG: alpha/beta hydrolase [Thermoanaerobaculia bacterium]
MRRLLLISLLLLSCGAKEIDKAYVFYLHGRIIEEQGRRPTHPEHGIYEYDEILRRLGGEGRVVLSEARAKDTDPDAYAAKVAKQIEGLLAKGVPGRRITAIGASKGALIAMLVSTKVRSPEVGYVIMANCNDWVRKNHRIDLHGEVLSIYDASDSVGGTCEPIFRQSKQLGKRREIRLETGLGHGFLYRPMKEWIEPALDWSRGR